ncbi:hypothetical protein KFK09_012656 [Dendrobium nobile]|uniref:RING-type E3 ubiquitin transferase n=1 Tax=Dendrobium nobile TaxID=94219 RepID=A0A8T3BG32_DENNO|nr:hypothetical protein KFK09_012656 [Dendrobium nobile]
MAEISASSSFSSLQLPTSFPPPLASETRCDNDLLRYLLRLSHEISLFDVPCPILGRLFSSIARKSKLLAILFDELLQQDNYTAAVELPRPASLCFREILVVLQRFKALLTDCSSRSRMRLILYSDTLANDFHMLALDLSTLLNILPLSDLRLSDDVRDLVDLLHSQCCRARSTVDPDVSNLRREILSIIHEIECEIVPERSRLAAILHNLGLDDTQSCRREVECLEREIGERVSEKWTAAMISLVGVVQYAKCVLYGASTPRSDSSAGKLFFASYDSAGGSQNGGTPPDFRCPISLDLMRDPVVVASGQTFDRESITHWIRSGHATCPSTGQALRHTNLIPNRALKNLISRWCREQNVPFALSAAGEPAVSGGIENKAALEAARMTAAFLVQKLSTSPSTEAANRIVHELRQLAKTQSENRAFIAEAGAVPLLLPFLCSNDSTLQLNAVTTLLNLSIFEPNKRRIMRADGSIDAVIHVMSNGEAWQAKENAATLLLSLSSMHSYRRRIGENHSAVAELVKLVRNGPASTKNDAMAAILSLAGDRKIVPLLVEKGVLEAALDAFAIEEAAEAAAAVIAGMAKRGGTVVVEKLEMEGAVSKLVGVLRRGTDSARDNAAAALVVLCRQSGGGVVAEVASMPGIEKVIRELMGFGTERGRRKAATLGRICRRWVAGGGGEDLNGDHGDGIRPGGGDGL